MGYRSTKGKRPLAMTLTGVIQMATLTPAELATELGTDARTARKFLRSVARTDDKFVAPGKGGRWAIEKAQIRSLRSKYAKWTKEQEAAKADRAAKALEADNTPEPDNSDTPLEELEGPSDDEMLESDTDTE